MNTVITIILLTLLVISVIGLITSTVNIKRLGKEQRKLYDTPVWESFLDNWEKMVFIDSDVANGIKYYNFRYENRYDVLVQVVDRHTAPIASIHTLDTECVLSPFNMRMSQELARRLLFRHLYKFYTKN